MAISMKTTSGKILASVALAGTAAAVAGMGTFGAFTATTSASQKVEAGTIKIGIGEKGNTMTTDISGMLPGDSTTKFVTLANSGDSNLGTVTLKTAAVKGTESLLTSDATKGLQISIESCPEAWTGADGKFTCAPGAVAALITTPVTGSNVLSGLSSIAAGKSDYLKITAALPEAADDTFQGKGSTVNFTFDATQRTATAN
jgi:predicted ribosomally synthesized peptide with SipW-like signal peptide